MNIFFSIKTKFIENKKNLKKTWNNLNHSFISKTCFCLNTVGNPIAIQKLVACGKFPNFSS